MSFLLRFVHVEASAASILFPVFSLLFFLLCNLGSLVSRLLEGVLRSLILLSLFLGQLLLFEFLLLLLRGLLVSQSL